MDTLILLALVATGQFYKISADTFLFKHNYQALSQQWRGKGKMNIIRTLKFNELQYQLGTTENYTICM